MGKRRKWAGGLGIAAKATDVTFIGLFVLLLAAPMAQMVQRFVPEKRLKGVVVAAEKPAFSLRSWFAGAFQQGFELWFAESMGFRGHLVRTDNQIGLSLFHEAASKSNDQVVLGKQRCLFQRTYINSFNRVNGPSRDHMRELAGKLRDLQKALAVRGIAFVLLISPSKAELYSDLIPDEFKLREKKNAKSAYELILPFLHDYGVHTVDAHAFFKEERHRSAYPLFPPGGIHWSSYGAYLVVVKLTENLEQQLGKKLVHVVCSSMETARGPRRSFAEADLSDLMNVWHFDTGKWLHLRPKFTNEVPAGEYRPRALMVGDSFAFLPVKILKHHRVFKGITLYFYYSTEYVYPRGGKRRIDKGSLNWEERVFSNDAIIMEINEIMIDRVGWGFIEDALKQLQPSGASAGDL